MTAGLAALTAAACATTPEGSSTPPNLSPVAGAPASARARLYADCVGQAAAAGTYDRNSDPDTELIRFTCSGAPARAFYTALEAWSARQDSQWTAAGRTWRSTRKVRRDLFGVDYCSAAPAGDHHCVIVLNAGDFLKD